MNSPKFSCFLFLALLAGCATATIPGQTTADATMKRDIYQNIRTMEFATQKDYDPKVLDTTHENLAAGAAREVWTVQSGTVKTDYEIRTRPAPQGGSDMMIRRLESPVSQDAKR